MGANDVRGRPVAPQNVSLDKRIRVQLNYLIRMFENRVMTAAKVANGASAGKAKTTDAIDYMIDGQLYEKGAANDFWDLTGETNTTATQFRGYLLFINAAGAASFTATANAATAAGAIALLRALVVEQKCVVGSYVADASHNFSGALGTNGTFYDGMPAAATIGEILLTY